MTPRPWIASHADRLLAAVVGAVYLVEVLTQARFADDRAVSAAVALAFAATLAARRSAPLLALIAGVGVILVSNLDGPPLADTATFLLAFAVAIYSTGRYAAARGGLAVLAALPLAVIEPGEPFRPADAAFIAIFIVGPWIAGRVIRHRHERERDLEREAREAVAEERARIARELHDIVAHAISVIVLQARGGRRLLGTEPDETSRALDAIEHAGEQALAEMRRLLGLLRDADEERGLAPRPGLARIDELAAAAHAPPGCRSRSRSRASRSSCLRGSTSPRTGSCRRALTNALKHAGPAHAPG